MMNQVKRQVAALSAIAGLGAMQAHAALPTSVTTAVETAETDISAVGALMIGLAVVAMTFKWLKASFF